MAKSFADTAEGWIFCGYAILLYKWERCRVLINQGDPNEVSKLARIEVKLFDEMVFDMSRDNRYKSNALTKEAFDVVKQTGGGHYAGPLLHGRFQVMESFVKGSYYLADHKRDDLLHRVAGLASDTMRFQTIEAAETYAKNMFTGIENPVISTPSRVRTPAIVKEDTEIMSLDIALSDLELPDDAAPPLATIPEVSEPATVPWDGVNPAPALKAKRIRKPAPSRSVSGDKPIVEAKKPRVVKETVKPAAPAKAKKPAVKAKTVTEVIAEAKSEPAPKFKAVMKKAVALKKTAAALKEIEATGSPKFKAVMKRAVANAAVKPVVKAVPIKTSKVALPGLSAKSPTKAAAKVVPAKKAAPVKVAAKPAKAAPKPPAKVVKAAPAKAPAKVGKPASGEPKKIGRPLTTGTATISSLTRDLLLKGKLTDKAIIAKAKEKFPNAAIAHNLVAVIRGKLVKAGVAVPPRKG